MHTAFSKGRWALTASGVTLLSLLASTVSFASVGYVGTETARESLGIQRSIELALPGPHAALASDMTPASPVISSQVESVASALRIGGMAVGLRVDEAVDASRMAPLVVSLGSPTADAMQSVHRVIEPGFRRCAQAVLISDAREVDYALHPMSAFLAAGPRVDMTVRDWLHRDVEGAKVGVAPLACLFQDRAEGHGRA